MGITKEELIKRLGITEKQYYGIDIIEGDVDLNDLNSIPEGFNPIVGGCLYLDFLESIPKGFNPIVRWTLYLNRLKLIPEGFNPIVGGCLFLDGLELIPEGFKPIVAESLSLDSLIFVPKGFNPVVGRNLYLNALTSIPDGFNPIVGWNLYLSSLTSIPKGFKPTVGESLVLYSLKSLPKWFNPIVGNSIFYNNNKLKTINNLNHQPILWDKHIKVDDIFVEIIDKKGNVYKVKEIIEKEHFFIVTDGNGKWAHGETIQKAKEDLIFKISDRDKSEYENLPLDTILSFEKAIECYHVITGSCEFGIKNFVKSNNIEMKDYSIREIIDLTKDGYGGKDFEKFFC